MSKTAILLIGHGSRNPAGNDEFLAFCERLAARHPERAYVPCFIEFHDVLVPDGIDRAVALGATRIVAVPVILLAAGHVKVEIPELLEEGRKRHPGVEIRYGRNIGVCDATVRMLVERVAEATADAPPDPAETGVLVLGRGSSDPDANGDVAKVARLFWEATPHDLVQYAFIGVTRPDLPTGVERLVRLGARTVVIAPYFLFTGVLIERIHALAEGFRERHPEVRFVVSKYFEFHDRLQGVIEERVRGALEGEAMMQCDTCTYRIEATAGGGHGHGHEHGHGHAGAHAHGR
jgi:sirohydrochlorin cobaltochelatase